MKTKILVDGNMAVVVSNCHLKQNIVSLDNMLVLGNFEKLDKIRQRTSSIRDFIKENEDNCICYHDEPEFFEIKKGNKVRLTVSESKNIIDDIVRFFYHELKNKENLQFGFIGAKKAKVLYNEFTKIDYPVKEYQIIGRYSRRKSRKNSEIYNSLIEHLCAYLALKKNKLQKRDSEAEKDAELIRKKSEKLMMQYITNIFFKPRGLKKKNIYAIVKKHQDENNISYDTKKLIIALRKNSIRNEKNLYYYRQEKAHLIIKDYSVQSGVFRNLNAIHITCDAKEEEKIIGHLRKLDYVSEIRKPGLICIPELINGSYSRRIVKEIEQSKWNLKLIHSDKCNENGYTGNGIVVAILDTGADFRHPDLISCFNQDNPGYNFIEPGNPPMDGDGHGTHVAGTIAGYRTGVAPGCELRAYKVLDDYGYGDEVAFVQGVEKAIEEGIMLCNMSLGFVNPSKTVEEILKVAARNMTICAAAGNEAFEPCYPGDYDIPNIISVAAVDKHKKRPDWSRISDNNDVSAPGIDIISCAPGAGYAEMSGTSMATPHATGAIALYIMKAPVNQGDLEKVVEQCSEKIGDKEYYGYGLIRPDIMLGLQEEENDICAEKVVAGT